MLETPHSLLVATTTSPHTLLSLAMGMMELIKLLEAGAMLAMPEWLVEVKQMIGHKTFEVITYQTSPPASSRCAAGVRKEKKTGHFDFSQTFNSKEQEAGD